MAETFKRCKTPFGFDVDGITRVVPANAVVSSNDPAYRKFKEHFEDIEVHVSTMAERQSRARGNAAEQVSAAEAAAAAKADGADGSANAAGGVEAATAAPGEKRNVIRARPAVAKLEEKK